jgi:hypothetical protein
MILTQVLEKKSVIQFFGIALIISPFVSFTLNTMIYLNTTHQTLANISLWRVILGTPLVFKILDIANIAIGIRLLSGSKKAWKYTLALLLCYIVLQIVYLNKNYRTNRFSIFYPIINSAIFVFIADQLVYKVKPKSSIVRKESKEDLPEMDLNTQGSLNIGPTEAPPVALPVAPPEVSPEALQVIPLSVQASKVITATTRKKIKFHLDGVGVWAQLTSVSNKGLQLRRLLEPPQEIYKREIKLSLRGGPSVRVRLAQHEGDDFFFEYTQLSANEVAQINTWLKKQFRSA